jgi:hypothetical protein
VSQATIAARSTAYINQSNDGIAEAAADFPAIPAARSAAFLPTTRLVYGIS